MTLAATVRWLSLAATPGSVPIGEVAYGAGHHPQRKTVRLPHLGGEGHALATWHTRGPLRHGVRGPLMWACNEELLFGWVSLDEADFAADGERSPLQQASRAVYAAMFETLDELGFVHLARCWNYLPRINFDGGGMERYRQFNIGRQDAFIAAGQAWLDGAPSACALGSHEGTLAVYFIASRAKPLAIENPRQVSAYRYPQQYGPRSPTFSRASLLALPGEEVLFISGTASIVGHASVHEGDVAEQTRETLRNLAVLVDAANAASAWGRYTLGDLAMKVFVRHPQDLPLIRAVLAEQGLGAEAIFLQADICRAELLVEIEAFGFGGGAQS